MNDRFKFRVFLKYNQIMCDIDSYCFLQGLNKCVFHFTKGGQKTLKNDDFILMQCTELKDKNGKLIFEGDILQSEEYPFKNEKGYNYAAEVLWDDASATFYYYTFRISNNVAGRSTGNTGELNEYEDWKVIGNIYENKELLESEG